jgi:phosphatidylserine decarboxylase
VSGLFARNERVVCVFETALGPMVLTLVGATIVGSMATVWHGVLDRQNTLRQWHYEGQSAPVLLQKGEEMGRFLLGSTVVMLFSPGSMQFNPAWYAGGPVQLGQAMSAQGLP